MHTIRYDYSSVKEGMSREGSAETLKSLYSVGDGKANRLAMFVMFVMLLWQVLSMHRVSSLAGGKLPTRNGEPLEKGCCLWAPMW